MSSREDTNDDGDQAYELVQHPSYILQESSKLSKYYYCRPDSYSVVLCSVV